MAPAEVGETPMRGFVSYVVTGILLGLALYLIVPAGSLRVAASPAVEQGAVVQSVNRARKGDRMMVPMSTVGKSRPVLKSPILLGVTRRWLVWPGVALICRRHAGTQKPWMTSFDWTSRLIFAFTGTTSWCTFVSPLPG